MYNADGWTPLPELLIQQHIWVGPENLHSWGDPRRLAREPPLSSLIGGHGGEEMPTDVPEAKAEGGGCPDSVFSGRRG